MTQAARGRSGGTRRLTPPVRLTQSTCVHRDRDRLVGRIFRRGGEFGPGRAADRVEGPVEVELIPCTRVPLRCCARRLGGRLRLRLAVRPGSFVLLRLAGGLGGRFRPSVGRTSRGARFQRASNASPARWKRAPRPGTGGRSPPPPRRSAAGRRPCPSSHSACPSHRSPGRVHGPCCGRGPAAA